MNFTIGFPILSSRWLLPEVQAHPAVALRQARTPEMIVFRNGQSGYLRLPIKPDDRTFRKRLSSALRLGYARDDTFRALLDTATALSKLVYETPDLGCERPLYQLEVQQAQAVSVHVHQRPWSGESNETHTVAIRGEQQHFAEALCAHALETRQGRAITRQLRTLTAVLWNLSRQPEVSPR